MNAKRLLALCLLPLGVCSVALAQQTLTFTNTTPAVGVTLSPGSTLGIAANGNVTASCVLEAGDAGRCQGFPGGGQSGNAPTVSLSATYNATQESGGTYPPGTIATISFTLGNSPEACVLFTGAGSAAAPSWAGAINSFTPRTVTLSTPNSTYKFKARCFNASGSGDSAELTVNISNGTPPPPTDSCTPEQQTLADASHPGYTRQASPVLIPDMRTFSNLACGDFPVSGSPVCLMLAQRNQYIAMRFVAPTDLSAYGLNFIEWQGAQVGGEASTSRTYVTISKCQGDFTRPGDPAITSTDPTFSDGCRNIRNAMGNATNSLSIQWNLTGVSTPSSCGITPGQTYYLNYILADPRQNSTTNPPGITAGEHGCLNVNQSQCGVQVRLQ